MLLSAESLIGRMTIACVGSLGENHIEVSITDFSIDEVKSVLQNGGFKAELFETRQLELLCLPQNLSLFLDTDYDPQLATTVLHTKRSV